MRAKQALKSPVRSVDVKQVMTRLLNVDLLDSGGTHPILASRQLCVRSRVSVWVCVWVCVWVSVWVCVWVCVCLEHLCGFCLCQLCLALNNPMVSYNREHTHPGMASGPGTADIQYHRAPAREELEKRESSGWLSRTARMLESQLQICSVTVL